MPGVAGLDWQTLQIPFVAGLDQKSDPRASNPPSLDIAMDVQLDSIGAVETRKTMAALGLNILGGGTLKNFRRLAVSGGELLCFTDVGLYTWDVSDTAWVFRGLYPALTTTETPKFATGDDQYDVDRAELGNVVVYAWSAISATVGVTYLAACDKATGAVIVAPTKVPLSIRPRLIALQTKIVYLFDDNAGGLDVLVAYAIGAATVTADIASVAAKTGGAAVVANYGVYYDACAIIGTDSLAVAARRATTTSYSVATVTSALTVVASTKARTCDGPIAVSSTPDGLNLQVVRSNTTNIQGDFLAVSALADVYTAQAIGTWTNTSNGALLQITAAHASVQAHGNWVCYAFWSWTPDQTVISSNTNTADNANTIGTQAAFVAQTNVVSRAFDYAGIVYVFMGFAQTAVNGVAGALQNTNFLFRSDGILVGKFMPGTAGGSSYDATNLFSATIGLLPGVALTGGSTTFSICTTKRRLISLGTTLFTGGVVSGFAEREPCEITFTFDSNLARRSVHLGSTTYIPSAEVYQYDSVVLTEVGFHIAPWVDAFTVGASGNIPNGTYGYKGSFSALNAAGDLDRSTAIDAVAVVMSSGPREISSLLIANNTITHRATTAIELWRTTINPTEDSPFYLVTDLNPSNVAIAANQYLANDKTASFNATTFLDNETDAVISTHQDFPENGAVLENIAPPAASIIAATEDRIFLAGIAGSPDLVWYSKTRDDGMVAQFNDALTIVVPISGGPITAVAFLNETVFVFRQRAIYAFPGVGDDNTGQGNGYGPVRVISADIGALNAESVCWTEQGLIFKSLKGWSIINRGETIQYIGKGVSAYDAEIPLSTILVPGQHEVRVVTAQRVLSYDYLVGQWTERSINDGLDAVIWNGAYVYLSSVNGPMQEQSTYSGLTYGMDLETSWVKFADLQGYARIRWADLLGEFRSGCTVRIRTAYDYQQDGSGNWLYTDDTTWTATPTVVGGPLQVSFGFSKQQCAAVKIRITVSPTTGGEACRLTGIAFEYGVKRGINRRLPASQKL